MAAMPCIHCLTLWVIVVLAFLSIERGVHIVGAEKTTSLTGRLFKAIDNNKLHEVKLLIEAGVDINGFDKHHLTPLLHATQKGNYDIVKLLVEKGANVTAKSGTTPLVFASGDKDHGTRILTYLINHGAHVNPSHQGGVKTTPLLAALLLGNIDAVKILVNSSADVNARLNFTTPLHLAVEMENFDIVKLLVKKGADVNGKALDGWTPLHEACIFGNVDITKCLLDHGADISARDKDGNTPLHIAAGLRRLETVKILVERGADINSKNNSGKTPLAVTRANKYKDIDEYLKSKGAVL